VPDTRPSDDGELDWQHIALFAAGALLGAIVGGGAALLFAPESGERTRHNLARRGRHLRGRAADAWDDLRHELSYATRRGRRTLSRKVNRALRDRRRQRELREDVLADD
jgi:gas vesicle protein